MNNIDREQMVRWKPWIPAFIWMPTRLFSSEPRLAPAHTLCGAVPRRDNVYCSTSKTASKSARCKNMKERMALTAKCPRSRSFFFFWLNVFSWNITIHLGPPAQRDLEHNGEFSQSIHRRIPGLGAFRYNSAVWQWWWLWILNRFTLHLCFIVSNNLILHLLFPSPF